MNPPLATERPSAALYNAIRWGSIVMIGLVVLLTVYYVYANVISRPTADVYIAHRGTAVSAVYGTVTISSSLELVLNAQNSGFFHLAPGFGTTVNLAIPVKRDQLMATVVDEAGERLLTQAKTDYEAAMARLKLGPGSLQPLKSAQDQLRAYDNLPRPDMVPRVQREAARNEVTRLQSAVDNEKLELQRQVDTTEGVLKTYESQLKRAEIRSPIDGIMIAQNYNENAYVTSGAALFTVASRDLYVSGAVNEEDVGKLKKGMKAEMHLYAYGNTQFTATLDAVLPSPDPNSSRYTVTLIMDNQPDNLLIGLTGEMNIILGRKQNALIIPARALLVDQVLVVADGVIEQRTVHIGFKSLEYAEVLDNLKEGDMVVVADQDEFHSGERVRPVPTK